MRPTPFVSRALCLTLAVALATPSPALLLAQDRGPEPPAALGAEDTTLDLRGLDALDLDPVTGALVYAREDLTLGEGPAAFALVRTYKPWAGDQANFGAHWASAFDVHLDVHPSRTRGAFVAEDGHRTFFVADAAGVLRATTGFPATIEVLADGYVLTGLGDERAWRFDGNGFPLSRVQDGQGVSYRYDAERRLVAVEGPWGKLQVERDARGVLAAVVAPSGARVTYARDEQGNLIGVGQGGLVERYTWDAAGRLAGLGDDAARLAWDALGRVVAIDGRAVRPTTARYLQTGGAAASDPRAREVHLERAGERLTVVVSGDGRRVERTGERGETTTVLPDERDRVVSTTVTAPGAAAPLVWTQTFDAQGRLVEQRTPEGVTRFQFSGPQALRPARITLADGRAVTFAYDARGRLLEAVAPGGATTRWTYDAQGRPATVTDPRGAVTTVGYDERGLVAQVDEAGVGTTKLLRDADGRVVKVRRPDGRLVDVERDALGRATRVSDPHGLLFAAAWDARGRLLRQTDELGRTTRYTWDGQGELARVEDEDGLLLGLEHDARGRLTATLDALGNRTTYERPDALTVVVTDATAGRRVTRSDALGRLVEETRGDTTLRYAYDAKGRLTSRVTPRGTDVFTWDDAGRLVGMKGPDGGYTLGWDGAGRLARLADLDGRAVEYAYTPAGDRAATKTPWGTTRYRHDAQGRVTGIELPDGGAIAIDLGPDGRRREVRYPNGVATRFAWQKGRLTEVVTAKGEQVLDRRAYAYDAAGRVASVQDAQGRTTAYAHDGRGRLVEARGPEGSTRWTWDAAGNRVAETRGGAEARAEVAAGNRLTRAGEQALTWDAAGQLVEAKGPAGTTRYAYDHDGHLVQATLPDGSTVRYGYAPNGTRLWREDGKGRTTYVNDLADVVGELGPAGELVASYVHGPEVDDVLAATRGGERHFFHHDLLGSVTSLTGKDGAVAARYGYDAFGRTTLAEGPAAGSNPWRFTGRPLDAATGLYDLRARAYAPELGRFTSPDPLGPLGGLNVYAYAEGDPTRFTDPFGLKAWYERLWEGTRDVASGVSSWASGLTWKDVGDGLRYAGRQSWAFTRGFGKGLYGAATGIVNTVLHPVDTVNGIMYAVEHWDETKEAFKALWEEYKDAAVNDPEKFAEMTGRLTAEVVVSIAGTKGLDKLAKARVVASAATRVASTARVVGSPVTRLAGRTGTTLATRFPRVAATVRRGAVMDRARSLELARRAAQPGNVMTRAGRRVVDTGRDLARAGRLAVREPGAFVVYSGRRLSRSGAALVAATGRGTWTATKRFGIPTVLAFEDQISDAIKRTGTHEAAMASVTREGERLLADAARLTPAELADRVDGVGRVYRDYRNRLLAGVHDEDLRLKAELDALNAAVERGEIPDNTLDSRMDAILSEYGRRRHNLMVDLYERNREAEHDMLHPSPNRTISFQDEIDLLKAARERVTDPAGRAVLDARIADLEALMAHEYELFRSGEHDALIAGIAGPPRDAGTPAPTPTPTVDPLAGTPPVSVDPDPTSDPFGDELPSDTLDGLVDPGDNE